MHLRDLIEPSQEGTADIASEIRRQMSGGFDLDTISVNLFKEVTRHAGRRERSKFNRASENVQKAVGGQISLQRRVDQLEELNSQLADAETAASRLTHIERAIGLASRREKLAGIIEKTAAFPKALTNLSGKEIEQLDRLQKDVNKHETRARLLERKLAEAREVRSKSGLTNPLNLADVTAWREYADELGRIEQSRKAARHERSGTRRTLAAALSAIGGREVDDAILTLSDHGDLFEFLRLSQTYAVRADSIKERLRLLEQLDSPEYAEQNTETLRNATNALRAWLRIPEPERLIARMRGRSPWLFSGTAILLSGIGLAAYVDPSMALVAAVGAGVMLPVLLLGNRRNSGAQRNAARIGFEKLGLAEPDRWNVTSVESRLRSLEIESAACEAAVQRARDRGVERQTLENELVGLSEQKRALDDRRQPIEQRLGLDALKPDAELVDFARALDNVRLARGADEAAAGKVESHEENYTSLLTILSEILDKHGESPPTDVVTATSRLNNLVNRNSQLLQALSDEQTHTESLKQNAIDREADLSSTRQIYSEAELALGDVNGLNSLIDSLEPFRELNKERTILEGQIELDRNELSKAGESELIEFDKRTIERLKHKMSGLATKESELRNGIANITANLKEAKHGTTVQDLISTREECRAKLKDLRDEALYTTAGKFLINAVEQEFEQTQMPLVLERARDHFSEFTHHNYELRMAKGGAPPRLFAVDLKGGASRELDELSDGTRAQLLLAARIAFAEEVEQGKRLPLFLDEALDQSDPRRFEAIVRSLGRVATAQGRQIFYLTSNPADVDGIQEALRKENSEIAASIDLGLIRTNSVSVRGPQELRVDLGPTYPDPDGMSSAEYGAVLGVPQFRPSVAHTEQHFFYVLWDDLVLLRDFLAYGIVTTGQWQSVARTPLAERLCSRSISSEAISLRLDLLEAFCEFWKIGRGRSVDRDDLVDSNALTERFVEDVVSITRELGGDAKQLISALEEKSDPRLRRFRKNSIEKLRHYFAENGYLDDRLILSEQELRLSTLSTPAANGLPDGIAIDCLNRWYAWARGSAEPRPT